MKLRPLRGARGLKAGKNKIKNKRDFGNTLASFVCRRLIAIIVTIVFEGANTFLLCLAALRSGVGLLSGLDFLHGPLLPRLVADIVIGAGSGRIHGDTGRHKLVPK